MSGTLRINTLGIAARTIIAPRLSRFYRAHPEVVLDIVVDDSLADIVAGRFDAGIRVGNRLEKDMVAVRLTPDLNMVAVASPDYLARRGTPKSPADLHHHTCINWRLQMDGKHYRWEFKKRGKQLEVAVNGPVITNHADVGIAAALNGLGIAYHLERDGVGEHLAQGRLVQVLADWSISRPGLYLYYPSRQHRPALLGAFIDCLLDRKPFDQP
ncbi:LysR substrate binding domain-containing protein [Cupriavidus plantarum]|uniref:LysR substrate binding domain-containing protein n=2 Tax=Cupriavidus plantarum TaxID=942865 RepID=A0A316ENA2_9BURK|nr:LysR substrate binding domain-containing protein [Cupriavidus plantarum]CAG2147554.1 HTH-type transcriptional regulator PgrR [Cupriavidus plantarum]